MSTMASNFLSFVLLDGRTWPQYPMYGPMSQEAEGSSVGVAVKATGGVLFCFWTGPLLRVDPP